MIKIKHNSKKRFLFLFYNCLVTYLILTRNINKGFNRDSWLVFLKGNLLSICQNKGNRKGKYDRQKSYQLVKFERKNIVRDEEKNNPLYMQKAYNGLLKDNGFSPFLLNHLFDYFLIIFPTLACRLTLSPFKGYCLFQ